MEAISTTPQPASNSSVRHDLSILTDDDVFLFNQGTHYRAADKLGSHLVTFDGIAGVHFAVWAPNAESVTVEGDFNGWNKKSHPLALRGSSGIWTGFIPGIGKGAHYKYFIRSREAGYRVEKADPYAILCEMPPKTASIVWDLQYQWNDAQWMTERGRRNAQDAPISIYEVHLGSWRRVPKDANRSLSYRELATELVDYVKEMGFTHVELLPVMEHPFFASWGYQCTGYFAPTSRFGSPEDLMYLVDAFHQQGIGVILDWVPSHFPTDDWSLGYFDGTHLYEHADPRQGFHPDWGSKIFNYGRCEVQSFLMSSALFWLEKYHIDGLRVDAVASMLYLDYSRKQGEWIPNQYGGNENIAAINFLRRMNEVIYKECPDVQTYAEESTAWPMVSRPTYLGGLGFGFKWDMGWMHDTLVYFSKDPVFRRYHHNNLTFRMLYAFAENFVLPLSHDEVTHGKGSLLGKMPGDEWQKFANLRALLGYMYGQSGKKLLFMGAEVGQWSEWQHDGSVEWHLLQFGHHKGLQRWIQDLNDAYRREPALHEYDTNLQGFEWVDCNDSDSSTLSFLRWPKDPRGELVLFVCNFTPVPRQRYQVGIPRGGRWAEILNSDADLYGGSGMGNAGGVTAEHQTVHGRPYSLTMTLPPLSIVVFRSPGQTDKG